jgi:hypothetical protein
VINRAPARPSVVIDPSPGRVPASQNYYSSDEARAQYRPVVIPLDEFLNPREPVALSPDEVARQRAAAELRAAPPQPPPLATPPATAAEADPFADDTAASDQPADAASPPAESSTEEPAEPTEENVFAEEAMPVEEEPAAEAAPEAEPSPESEPADADEDPFN